MGVAPLIVAGDPDGLRRAFTNLVENGLESTTSRGSVAVRVETPAGLPRWWWPTRARASRLTTSQECSIAFTEWTKPGVGTRAGRASG